MATLQFKRIKEPFKNFNLLKITIESGAEQYALQPGEPLVASYKDGDAIRTVLVVANAQGGIEFIDNDGLEARVEAAEETIKDVTFVTEDTPSLHLGKDSAGLNTILSGDVKVSSASGNILSVNASSTGNTQGLYAKVVLKKDGNGSLVLTTSSLNGEQTQTIPLDKEVHLASNGSFYNPITKSLGLKLTDGSTVQVDLTNVVNVADVDDNIIQDKALGLYASTDLRYDAARNILYFFRSGSEPKEIKLNSTQILDDVTYDSIKEAIIIRFIMQSGEFKVLEVPVSQLIREWQPYNDMHTVQIERTENKTGGQDLLSADVKIASDPDNILTKKNYQLYVKGIASNIKYSADPSSGATVKDKIDELQSGVSKVSGAVDTFNDAIEYVEQIVSAVSGISEAKINAIISGAGLNSDGSYKDKTEDPDSYPYLANAASLDKADGILARNLRTVSGQVDNHTTAITTNAADIQSLSAIVQSVIGSAPSTAVDAISGKVENIITAVRLNPDGSYQPVGHPGHSFIESATDIQGAQIALDKAIQEIVDKEGLTIGTDSAHTITYVVPSGVTALAGTGASLIDDAKKATSVISDSLIGLSGTVSGTLGAIIDLQGDIQDISDKVDALSGVSQDEIDRIKAGAGLRPEDGQYIPYYQGRYIKTASSLYVADSMLDSAISGISDSVDVIKNDVTSISGKADTNASAITEIQNAIGGTGSTSIQTQLDNKQEKFVPSDYGAVRFAVASGSSSGIAQNVISGTVRLVDPVDYIHSDVVNNIRIAKDGDGAERGLYSVADLQYNSSTNTLSFTNSYRTTPIPLAGVTLIKDFYYDPDSRKIVIEYATDSGTTASVDIDVTQMGIIDVDDTSTIDLTKDSTQTGAAAVIKAEAKISPEDFNILEAKTGGLYVGGYASNIVYHREASQSVYTVIDTLSGNVSTVYSGMSRLSGDVLTMSGKVEAHEGILSGISGASEDIKKISAIAETLSATTQSIGLNNNGTKKPHTGTTFLTSTTDNYNSEIEKLDSLFSNVTSGAGFIITSDGKIKYDKDRFSGNSIVSGASSLTDAIDSLAAFTETGFLSGCGLTSAGTINVNAFSGSSVLSGLTTGNSLTDAIVDLDEAFEACCDATMNAIGNIDEDGNWEIPSAVTEALSGSGIDSGSSISDVLAALAENGLSIEDFYNDPADPQDREYNVVFSTVIGDDGKPKIAADVEFFDCGDYDQP